jgi:trigger factor
MKISKKPAQAGRMTLTCSVPAGDVGPVLKTAYLRTALKNQIAPNHEKTPQQVLEEKLGADFAHQIVRDELLHIVANQAVSASNLRIVGNPRIITAGDIVDDEAFDFVTEVLLMPSYDLPSYEPITMPLDSFSIPQEEVSNRMSEATKTYSETITDTSHDTVQADDKMNLSMKTSVAGEPLEPLTFDSRRYDMGQRLMPEDFEQGLLGMKVGETKTIEFQVPDFSSTPSEESTTEKTMQTYTSEVTIVELLKEIIPAITDAWVEKNIHGCTTAEDFKEQIVGEVEQEARRQYNQFSQYHATSEFSKRFKGKIEDPIYENARDEYFEGFKSFLKQQNMTQEEYLDKSGMDENQFSMMTMMQVREQLVQQISMDALAEHLNLTPSDEDIKRYYSLVAPGQEFQMRQEMEGTGRQHIVNTGVRRMLASEWLVEHSTFTDPHAPQPETLGDATPIQDDPSNN